MLLLDSRVPIRPARRLKVLAAAAMPNELGHVHSMAGVGETLRHIAHFQGRPAQPMNEQKTQASSRQANTLIHKRRSRGPKLRGVVDRSVSSVAAPPGLRFEWRRLPPRRASATRQPSGETSPHVIERMKRGVLQAALTTKLGERAFGDDVVRALGHTKVRSAVADYHASARLIHAMAAFAIAGL